MLILDLYKLVSLRLNKFMENICYKIKLTKNKSNHSNLRSDVIDGYCHDLPQKNVPFIMFSKGLEGGVRIVKTTPIAKLDVSGDFKFDFETRNSSYSIEIIENCKRSELESFLSELSVTPNFIN